MRPVASAQGEHVGRAGIGGRLIDGPVHAWGAAVLPGSADDHGIPGTGHRHRAAEIVACTWIEGFEISSLGPSPSGPGEHIDRARAAGAVVPLGGAGAGLAGRADDHGVTGDGHGVAEFVIRFAVAGGQLGLLGPNAGAAHIDVGRAAAAFEGHPHHGRVAGNRDAVTEVLTGRRGPAL